MNSRQAALREVESLCSAICDGTISDEQFARLQTYLRVSATARACYIRYIRTHNALLWVCARDDAPVLRRPATVSNVKSRPPAWQSAVTVVHSRESDGALHSRGTARSRRRTLTALGSAAGVLAAILLVMGILSPPAREFVHHTWVTHMAAQGSAEAAEDQWSANHVAEFVGMRDALWDRPRAVGDRLVSGQQVQLLAGVAQLRYSDGVEVVLEGPAEFEPGQPGRGTLHHGKLVALVPPAAAGFTLLTRDAVIVDLGTQFAVNVGQYSPTEVHVFRGKVEAHLIGSKGELAEGLTLNAGMAASLDRTGANVASYPADQRGYVRQLEVPSQPPHRVHAFRRWNQYCDQLRAAEGLVAHYAFLEPTGQVLPNLAPNAISFSDGRLPAAMGSDDLRWVFGRWQKKSALDFPGAAERFVLVEEIGADLSDAFSVLTSLRPRGTGGMLWQMRAAEGENIMELAARTPAAPIKPGQLELQVTLQNADATTQLEVTSLESVIEAGRWHLVAVTYDGNALRIHCDGRLVGQQKLSPVAIEPNASLAIGGGDQGEAFDGLIDELAVLQRQLSLADLAEISELAQADLP